MIIDACIFNNEFDVLYLRLNLLRRYVDKFVICEANRTHSGTPKGSLLREHLQEDNKLSRLTNAMGSKIEFVMVDLPESTNRWNIENWHRSGCLNGITVLPTDFVMISDVDEVPDMTRWNGDEGAFLQRHSYYAFDLVDPRIWKGTVCVKGWRFMSPWGCLSSVTPQDVRNFRDVAQPCGYGWHFGWLGGYENALRKIGDFAHSELEENKNQNILHSYTEGVHPMDGTKFICTTEGLPDVCYEFPWYFRGVV
jgi:hypothetical protein